MPKSKKARKKRRWVEVDDAAHGRGQELVGHGSPPPKRRPRLEEQQDEDGVDRAEVDDELQQHGADAKVEPPKLQAPRDLIAELKAERKARRKAEKKLEKERKARREAEAAREADRLEAEAKIEAERNARLKAEKAESLANGTYYSTVDEVWGIESVKFDEASFTRLIRAAAPHFVPRRRHRPVDKGEKELAKLAVYTFTKECALDGTYNPAEVAPSRSSRGSVGPEEKLAIWPVDIFGQKPSLNTEIAHLVPASYNVSTLYRDVAICAFGLDEEAAWDVTQKVIHGSKVGTVQGTEAKEMAGAPSSGPGPIHAGVDSSASGSSSRKVSLTGLKHFVPSKIRLSGQKQFLDATPGVHIIPAMSLGKMKKWKGGRYKAIVMVGDVEGADAAHVCRGIGMIVEGGTAKARHIEKARALLSDVVTGMAYSLKRRSKSIRGHLNRWQRRKIKKLRKNFTNILGPGVIVPKRRPLDSEQPLRVRLVEFGSANDDSDDDSSSSSSPGGGSHPAPDPLLVAVRAAVNWSARHNQRLMAAAEEPKDLAAAIDADEEALHRLAEQEYLAWREEAREEREQRARNVSRTELARRLGQPHGYKGEGGGGAVARPAATPTSTPKTPRKSHGQIDDEETRGGSRQLPVVPTPST